MDRATEAQVLELVFDGVPQREIARELGISTWQVHQAKQRAGLVGKINDMHRRARRAVIQEYIIRRCQNYEQASEQLGIPANTLRNWAVWGGIPDAYQRGLNRLRAEVFRRWQGGETQRELAEEYGVHICTIRNYIRAAERV